MWARGRTNTVGSSAKAFDLMEFCVLEALLNLIVIVRSELDEERFVSYKDTIRLSLWEYEGARIK